MISPCSILSLLLLVLQSGSSADAFASPRYCISGTVARQLHRRTHPIAPLLSRNNRDGDDDDDDDNDESEPSEAHRPSSSSTRRDVIRRSAAAVVAGGLSLVPTAPRANALPPIASFSNPLAPQANRSNGGTYVPGKRCTAYQVDATVPPSLIPYRASREAAILKNLGTGKGTSKAPFIENDINLNNILNRAVFGSIEAVQNFVSGKGDGKSGPNYQSFVFLGANFDNTFTASPERAGGDENADASLAVGLLTDICKPRERAGNTAIGLAFAPRGGQGALEDYLNASGEGAEGALVEGLRAAGADEGLAARHLPILRFAKRKRLALLALAPEPSDMETVRRTGLGSLESSRRDAYVADAEGFVALTQEPKFKLYTDKSLLKDAPSSSGANETTVRAEQANFFAERILVHEACATAASEWATRRPESMVVVVAPIPDVRFMGGINGRVPRVCRYLNPESAVDDDAVTTILLNPSARETLSESKFLRLEIGTAPNNWTYQTKVADYLWFSSMPKVNMLPRMMNEQ